MLLLCKHQQSKGRTARQTQHRHTHTHTHPPTHMHTQTHTHRDNGHLECKHFNAHTHTEFLSFTMTTPQQKHTHSSKVLAQAFLWCTHTRAHSHTTQWERKLQGSLSLPPLPGLSVLSLCLCLAAQVCTRHIYKALWACLRALWSNWWRGRTEAGSMTEHAWSRWVMRDPFPAGSQSQTSVSHPFAGFLFSLKPSSSVQSSPQLRPWKGWTQVRDRPASTVKTGGLLGPERARGGQLVTVKVVRGQEVEVITSRWRMKISAEPLWCSDGFTLFFFVFFFGSLQERLSAEMDSIRTKMWWSLWLFHPVQLH